MTMTAQMPTANIIDFGMSPSYVVEVLYRVAWVKPNFAAGGWDVHLVPTDAVPVAPPCGLATFFADEFHVGQVVPLTFKRVVQRLD